MVGVSRTAESAVTVTGLRRTFGDFVAVDGISLDVARGEVFGFLGPNGAGKSTTIKMLCGLLMPTSGSGTVGGYDITGQAEQIKKSIGYMSQRFSLYEDLRVEENMNFFGGIYGVKGKKLKERKEWVIETAGLKDMASAVTGTLPGGIKQRLALGCALLHEPPIIFLDEPTSGVDPLSRRRFWSLIYELSKGGGTTVFVTTHYMDEAEYCDRLAMIYRGIIIAEGEPSRLKTACMKRDILEVEVEGLSEAMEVLESHAIEADVFGSVLHCTVDDAASGGPHIRKVLSGAGMEVTKMERILPSLEDVFVHLIETSNK